MAHFAQKDNDNKIINVIVVDNRNILDENGNESEAVGIAFCKSLFRENTDWIQTSYNGSFRKNFAGVGYTYSQTHDAFIAPRPKNEGNWQLNMDTCQWEIIE